MGPLLGISRLGSGYWDFSSLAPFRNSAALTALGLQRAGAFAPRREVLPFNVSVNACKQGHQPPQAVHLFQVMQLRRLLPTVITHNARVSAYTKGHQPQQAMQF